MEMAILGRTGLKVSRLGFGAMRLPMSGEDDNSKVNLDLAIPMIHAAFDAGVNYIDTAVGYCNQDSQVVVGIALKGWRDRIVVSSKNHEYNDETAWWTNLENSLKRLDIDCIDIYNTHGVNLDNFKNKVLPQVSKWLTKAKSQKMIRHICTSFHDNNAALTEIINADFYDVITLQYNMLDQQLSDAIQLAQSKNIGIVAMGPVMGGRLGHDNPVLQTMVSDIKRMPELALRFVLSNPAVTIALSGMSTMQQVEENCQLLNSGVTGLSVADQKVLQSQLEQLKKSADLYCSGCQYCMPCPHGVNIPGVFSTYNQARIYGITEWAKQHYARMDSQTPPKSGRGCVKCGICEPKCPQNIPIRQQLEQAHQALI